MWACAAGFGIGTITPAGELPLAGIGGKRFGKRALDDLKVRAIAVSQGGTTLVLVSVDVLYVSRDFSDQLGAWLEQDYDISSKNLLVAATHTHCAPLLLDRYFDDVRADADFAEQTSKAAQAAVRAAIDSQSSATVEISSGLAEVSIHRRASRLDRIALRKFRYSRLMANRPNWSGPVDNTVRAVRFRRQSADQPDIVLMSAGCHPSIIRDEVYSADYPGLIEGHLNDGSNPPAQVIFVQGFSGDSRPLLLESAPFAAWPPGQGFDWVFDRQRFRKNSLLSDADWVAATLAKAVNQAPGIPMKGQGLSARRIAVPLALEESPDLEAFRRIAESKSEPDWRLRYARFALSEYSNEPVVSVRVHRWSLGPGLCIVGLEGEIFSEFSDWMINEFAPQGIHAIPAGCVGGMVGYIPTASDLAGGGYEVDRSRALFGLPSRFSDTAEGALKSGIREVMGPQVH